MGSTLRLSRAPPHSRPPAEIDSKPVEAGNEEKQTHLDAGGRGNAGRRRRQTWAAWQTCNTRPVSVPAGPSAAAAVVRALAALGPADRRHASICAAVRSAAPTRHHIKREKKVSPLADG